MLRIKQLAFTLIELLVVIAVIGILSGLIVVSMGGVSDKASIARSKVFANSLRNSLLLNLVSEWKFNNDTNDSWGANSGTWSGPTGTNTVVNYRPSAECVSDQCLNLDGSDDIVSGIAFDQGIIKGTNYDGSFTLEIWAKSGTQSGNEKIVMGRTGWHAGILASGSSYNFQMVKPAGSPYYNIYISNTNKWQHLVAVYENHIMKFYSNGIKSSTEVSVEAIYNYGNGFYLGGAPSSTYYFNGTIDEARAYNAAMPVSQARERYLMGLNSLLSNGTISSEEYVSRVLDFNNNCAKK